MNKTVDILGCKNKQNQFSSNQHERIKRHIANIIDARATNNPDFPKRSLNTLVKECKYIMNHYLNALDTTYHLPINSNTIAKELGFSVSKARTMLMLLELLDIIEPHPVEKKFQRGRGVFVKKELVDAALIGTTTALEQRFFITDQIRSEGIKL